MGLGRLGATAAELAAELAATATDNAGKAAAAARAYQLNPNEHNRNVASTAWETAQKSSAAAAATATKSSYDPGAYKGTAVVMPGYGGQCAVAGSNRDASGNRINIAVAMPGGNVKVFATEAEFQAACYGGQPSYAPAPSPPYPSYQYQQPQPINIQVGTGGVDYSRYFTDLQRQQAQLIKTLTVVPSLPGTTVTPAQQTLIYTSGPDGGPSYPPAAFMAPGTVPADVKTVAEEKPGTPWWIFALIGVGAMYALGGKGKKGKKV